MCARVACASTEIGSRNRIGDRTSRWRRTFSIWTAMSARLSACVHVKPFCISMSCTRASRTSSPRNPRVTRSGASFAASTTTTTRSRPIVKRLRTWRATCGFFQHRTIAAVAWNFPFTVFLLYSSLRASDVEKVPIPSPSLGREIEFPHLRGTNHHTIRKSSCQPSQCFRLDARGESC